MRKRERRALERLLKRDFQWFREHPQARARIRPGEHSSEPPQVFLLRLPSGNLSKYNFNDFMDGNPIELIYGSSPGEIIGVEPKEVMH